MQENLESKEKKAQTRKKILNPLLGEGIIFSLVFVLGLLCALQLSQIFEKEKIQIPQFSISQFLISFFIIVLFILLLIALPKFKKAKKFIYQTLFILIALYGIILVLSTFLPPIWVLIVGIFIFLCWSYFKNVLFQDLLVALSIAGISVPLGLSINPKSMIILLVFFAFYDFIAVYKTKHMIKMAKSMMEAGAITAFFIPFQWRNFFLKIKDARTGKDFIVLGGGDIAFPLLFAISVLRIDFVASILVSIFAFMGLTVSYFTFALQKTRRPIPALPPIALFAIVGYIIALML